jgi:epoxyqueuosine reductase QueG
MGIFMIDLNEIQEIIDPGSDTIWSVADIPYSLFRDDYKRAIVLARHYEYPLPGEEYNEEKFHHVLAGAKTAMDEKIHRIKNLADKHGIKSLVPPASQTDETELKAPFSFKYAAVQSGLGWIGKNGVLITRKFGPRVRLGALLIDYPLDCGTPVKKSFCGTCNACAEACPWKLIRGINWTLSAKREDLLDYQLCNKKRSEYLEICGRKHECGHCILACPRGVRTYKM